MKIDPYSNVTEDRSTWVAKTAPGLPLASVIWRRPDGRLDVTYGSDVFDAIAKAAAAQTTLLLTS